MSNKVDRRLKSSGDMLNVCDIDLLKSPRAQKAMEIFSEGYSCSQATFLAFNDLLDISYNDAAKLASSFSAGMGRLREVCGSLTGIFMTAGMLYGHALTNEGDVKIEHNVRIQALTKRFKELSLNILVQDSIICRDILHLNIIGADDPYRKSKKHDDNNDSPCAKLVEIGAFVLEEYISKNPF